MRRKKVQQMGKMQVRSLVWRQLHHSIQRTAKFAFEETFQATDMYVMYTLP